MTPAAWVFLLVAVGLAAVLGLVCARLRAALRDLAAERARRVPVGMPRTSSRPPPPPSLVVMALALLGCAATPAQNATTAANVVEATGQGTLAVLKTCTVVLAADAKQPHPAPPGALTMTDEQHARVVEACDAVEASYDAIQRTHAVLLGAVEEARRLEKAGGKPDWLYVATLGAEALEAVEAGRLAYERGRVVLAEVSR